MTNPQQALPSMVKNWKHFPWIRNKTRVPTLITSIQHSFGSVGHSNQGRRSKRNPDRKRRSETLSVCKCWSFKVAVPSLFGKREWFCGTQFLHGSDGGGWFGDNSSVLHLLCTLFLLLLHQLHLRLSGIRSQRLGTPDLNTWTFCLLSQWVSKEKRN